MVSSRFHDGAAFHPVGFSSFTPQFVGSKLRQFCSAQREKSGPKRVVFELISAAAPVGGSDGINLNLSCETWFVPDLSEDLQNVNVIGSLMCLFTFSPWWAVSYCVWRCYEVALLFVCFFPTKPSLQIIKLSLFSESVITGLLVLSSYLTALSLRGSQLKARFNFNRNIFSGEGWGHVAVGAY